MQTRKTLYETLSFYLIAATTALLDQLVKFGIVAVLSLGNSRPLVDGLLQLTYVQNRGAAFSLFWGHADKLGLTTILVALGLIIYQWRARPKELVTIVALGLYLGGAMGNGIDRLVLGYVRDMFDLRWHGQNVFPIFNVADVALNVAAGLLLLQTLRASKRTEA